MLKFYSVYSHDRKDCIGCTETNASLLNPVWKADTLPISPTTHEKNKRRG